MIEVRVRENYPPDGIDIFVRLCLDGGQRRYLQPTEHGFEWSEQEAAGIEVRPTLTLDDAAGRALLEELMRHYAGAQDLHTVRSDLLHERGPGRQAHRRGRGADEATTMMHVVFPVFNRADLFEQALESWREVDGIGEATLHFWIEPGCEESVKIATRADFAGWTIVGVNARRMGHAANLAQGMNWAFQHTDYVIATVDDYIVSTDILRLHAWHRDNYQADPSVLCLRSGSDFAHPGGFGAVLRTQLMGLPAGFHADQWAWLAANWEHATDQGWWAWVNESFLQGGPRRDVLAPARSRARDLTGADEHPGGFVRRVAGAYAMPYFEVKDRRERATGFQRWIEEGMY